MDHFLLPVAVIASVGAGMAIIALTAAIVAGKLRQRPRRRGSLRIDLFGE